MKQVAEYKQHAQQCREMAARAKSNGIREHLLRLAKQWCELAKQRREFLEAKAKGPPH